MPLLDMKGGYLYQVAPELFPEGRMTQNELALWTLYYRQKNEAAKASSRR